MEVQKKLTLLPRSIWLLLPHSLSAGLCTSSIPHPLAPRAEFVMVFTTVSQAVLDTREVLELYRVRWQIELRFKHLKSLLGLGCLP
ncbi:MAG TPA: transposase, partial [Verrucomicrobiae bacterium]|nr:transposase [Verrucomicrobiae bacterium]